MHSEILTSYLWPKVINLPPGHGRLAAPGNSSHSKHWIPPTIDITAVERTPQTIKTHFRDKPIVAFKRKMRSHRQSQHTLFLVGRQEDLGPKMSQKIIIHADIELWFILRWRIPTEFGIYCELEKFRHDLTDDLSFPCGTVLSNGKSGLYVVK